MRNFAFFVFLFIISQFVIIPTFFLSNANAAELSTEALAGKWNFKYMILDGDTANKRTVNRILEFMPDGKVINYGRDGKKTYAEYKISNGMILYSDEHGDQKWKVESFSKDKLHIDNRGAEMFLERE